LMTKNLKVVILDKKGLLKDYTIGFFTGIYAGFVVLFADKIYPFLCWRTALYFILLILLMFFIGFLIILILCYNGDIK